MFTSDCFICKYFEHYKRLGLNFVELSSFLLCSGAHSFVIIVETSLSPFEPLIWQWYGTENRPLLSVLTPDFWLWKGGFIMKAYTVERFFHRKVSSTYNYYIFIGALHFIWFLKVFHSIHYSLSNSSAEDSCSPQHPHRPVMPKTMPYLKRVHIYLQYCIRRLVETVQSIWGKPK